MVGGESVVFAGILDNWIVVQYVSFVVRKEHAVTTEFASWLLPHVVIEYVVLVLRYLLLDFFEDAFPHPIHITLAVEVVQHEGPVVDGALLPFEAVQALQVFKAVAFLCVLKWNFHSLGRQRPFIEK